MLFYYQCYHTNNLYRLIQRAQPGLIKKINRTKKPFGGRVSKWINISCIAAIYNVDIAGESFLFSGCLSEAWVKRLPIV